MQAIRGLLASPVLKIACNSQCLTNPRWSQRLNQHPEAAIKMQKKVFKPGPFFSVHACTRPSLLMLQTCVHTPWSTTIGYSLRQQCLLPALILPPTSNQTNWSYFIIPGKVVTPPYPRSMLVPLGPVNYPNFYYSRLNLPPLPHCALPILACKIQIFDDCCHELMKSAAVMIRTVQLSLKKYLLIVCISFYQCFRLATKAGFYTTVFLN